jgi:hypothetical protein
MRSRHETAWRDHEEWRGEPHDPDNAEEEENAKPEREQKAGLARCGPLAQRQTANKHRQENEVVDAEHDFERA